MDRINEEQAWHEQDAFWALVGPLLFTMRRAELAQAQVSEIVALGTVVERG